MEISKNLSFITPAFCSGADQQKAEMRPTEFKNLLSWWWQAFYGEDDSKRVFGSVGDKVAHKSLVTIRIIEKKLLNDPSDFRERLDINDSLSYLAFFAHRTRYQPKAYFSPGTSFELKLVSKLEKKDNEKLDEVLKYALAFGSVGYRSRRGFGAFISETPLSLDEFNDMYSKLHERKNFDCFHIVDHNDNIASYDNWKKVLQIMGAGLKELRSKNPKSKFSAGKPPSGNASFLGSSGNRQIKLDRQASAFHLRPVLLDDGDFIPFMFLYQGLHSLSKSVPKGNASDIEDVTFTYFKNEYKIV